jgi:glycosyltransferase involved in cell wall biosynthesis
MLVGEENIATAVVAMDLPVKIIPTRNTGWREVVELRRALLEDQSQVLMTDRPRDLRIGAMALVGKRLPLVYRFNVRRDRPPTDLITRLAYRRVAATVFLTPEWAERTIHRAPFMGKVPYRVIWNGIDHQAFRPDPAAGLAFRVQHSLGDGPVLLASGALFPDKRYDVLIDALPLMRPDGPLLVICGTGMEEERLREQARRLDVPVRFLGFLPPPAISGAYNAATCVVHAGPVETFGRSVAEAMACARPVVAVRAGALTDVIGDAGVLVPPNDSAAFAAAVSELLRDEPGRARLGKAARERCLERFTMERSLSEYESLFLEVAGYR